MMLGNLPTLELRQQSGLWPSVSNAAVFVESFLSVRVLVTYCCSVPVFSLSCFNVHVSAVHYFSVGPTLDIIMFQLRPAYFTCKQESSNINMLIMQRFVVHMLGVL